LDLEAVTIQIRHVEKNMGLDMIGPNLLSACGDVARIAQVEAFRLAMIHQ
jgi:hypothetical protein